MVWATIWATFSKTHLVNLPPKEKNRRQGENSPNLVTVLLNKGAHAKGI
jgi:hypothetical protein